MNSENSRSQIPPLHPDTIAVERHLSEFAEGQSIAISELAMIARAEPGTKFDAHVRSACRRLQNGQQMKFHRRDGTLTRLDPEGIKNFVGDQIRRAGRISRRIIRTASITDVGRLTESSRNDLVVSMLQARGMQRFTDSRSGAKLLTIVANAKEKIIELQDTWKLLTNNKE